MPVRPLEQGSSTTRPAPQERAALPTFLFAAGAVFTLAGLVFLSACSTSGGARILPYDDALRQVHRQGDELAWNGIRVGMSRGEVERALARRLPMPGGADPLCDYYYTSPIEVHGNDICLAFTGGTRSARLASITIHTPSREAFDARAIVHRLESLIGPLEFVPSRHEPNLGPYDGRNAVFRTPTGDIVFLNPDHGISFGDVCYD